MQQMTRILISDPQWQGLKRSGEAQRGEEFCDVADFRPERDRLRMLGLAGRKEMIVFFQHRAAPGGIGDDRVEFLQLERSKISPSQIARRFAHAGVRRQRSATKLTGRHHNFAAIGCQDPDGRIIQPRKGDLRNSSGEESNPRAQGAGGRIRAAQPAEEKRIVDARQQPFPVGQPEQL